MSAVETAGQGAGPAVAAPTHLPLPVLARRVVGLTIVCGIVEMIGYMDVGRIYPAIMTGNTVQLGYFMAQSDWVHFLTIGYAIASFFAGCMIASLIRRHLQHPPLELVLMAVLLVVAGFVRQHPALRVPVELPLLALALSIQGETVGRFGGVSLQTLVVTNNMVKFSDAVVGRFLSGAAGKRPTLQETVLPGLSWLTYSLSAALGAEVDTGLTYPFFIPAAVLLLVTVDLLRNPDR
jgi:uncharacterized membrane protein YoaK (UPF0700 family)